MHLTSILLAAASAFNEQGTELLHAGRYAEAETAYTRALETAGPDEDRSAVLNNIAALYRRTGRFTEAERIYQNLLAERERRFGPNSPELGLTHNNLAELLRTAERPEQAEAHARRAIEILERAGAEQRAILADALHTLGCIRFDRGDAAESGRLHERSVSLRRVLYGDRGARTASGLMALAVVRGAQGRDAEAESLLRKVLAIHENRRTKSPEVAVAWHNLAQVYVRAGRFAAAEDMVRTALQLWAGTVGESHRDYALGLVALGYTFERQGKASGAAQLYERALAIVDGSGLSLETVARARLAATRRVAERRAALHTVSVEQLLLGSRREAH